MINTLKEIDNDHMNYTVMS